MLNDGALTGEQKADFNEIYVRPDPREYFRALVPLDYQVPQRALPIFESVLAASARARRPRSVLDVCCSYGINAALLRCAVRLRELGARYTDPELDDLSSAELAKADQAFYQDRLRRPGLSVVGLDVSAPAIDYAVSAGLLTAGWAEDLESSEPSAALVEGLRDVGLIICTGGVGYIGADTFDRLLRAVPDPQNLWLAIFVLRVFSYDEIAATFALHGLVTDKIPDVTFKQRRFADHAEYEAANHDIVLRGLDPTGKEADGWYHAECFLTRPAAEATQIPVAKLLVACG
ncbi:MAG: hypothetical protein M3Z25_18920 [Actinomycetota bacterium]|nr:hypothetical protein [Actinomycetota bacterium]